METILRFIASPAGRWIRVAVGTSLITAGLAQGEKGRAMAALGLVPLAAGALDLCLLSPLVGLPFEGEALRRALGPATHA
ncbi:hypothetical protein PK28_17670 (plasmid) [Hymenobacter sp. DG25B]|uniref:DUF2892 domain-containing protein n=1 Tax=Hymenobacter sp. DG25B TaxID=1385664 RepID=UPI000540A992|nr:DUF2892 domain-containing protein [Hymenobacter sp. DG25B]AIZ65477.1 hypothetical protein PK28_17670 [Hymenobacter sp. DG25B]